MTPSRETGPFSLFDASVQRVESALAARFEDRFRSTPISDPVGYQIESGGKRIRSASTLWIAERMGVGDRAIPIALAVELLHALFLVHDDIEDGDTFRRGRPALWSKFGIAEALNASDGIASEVFALGTEIDAPDSVRLQIIRDLTDVYRITVEGQALDLSFRADPSFTLEAYDDLVRKKTGHHLVCGWVGAFRLADRSEAEIDSVWKIGSWLGPAFQIRDDVLDLTPGKGRGGDIGGDIREGKASILFAHSVRERESLGSRFDRIVDVLRRDRAETSDEDVNWVIEQFHECGAVAFAEAECRRLVDLAIEEIQSLPVGTAEDRSALASFAHHLVDRIT